MKPPTCPCVMFDLPGNPVCGEPPVAQVTVGCIHEHLESEWLCLRHIALAKQNDLICSNCKTGSRGHSCQVYALAEVNAAGERTILVDTAAGLGEAS